MTEQIKEISSKTAWDFLKPRHYAGRKPQISVAYGLYVDNGGEYKLSAVCTFGKPASPSLCRGICGEENSKYVYELNRLCRIDEYNGQLSKFVSAILRKLKDRNWIIVSYADTGMHHNGYIYQACNFLYTGKTKERTDKYTDDGKHSRHYDKDKVYKYRQLKTSKHRYVFFATHSKHQRKKWLMALQYPIQQYPKDKNENYILGEYQKRILIPSITKKEK